MKTLNYRFISIIVDSELLEAVPINFSFLYSAEPCEIITHSTIMQVTTEHFGLLQKQMD